jgi:TRAP-type C4-dicarboxylate transport system permease small subunit
MTLRVNSILTISLLISIFFGVLVWIGVIQFLGFIVRRDEETYCDFRENFTFLPLPLQFIVSDKREPAVNGYDGNHKEN